MTVFCVILYLARLNSFRARAKRRWYIFVSCAVCWWMGFVFQRIRETHTEGNEYCLLIFNWEGWCKWAIHMKRGKSSPTV